MISLIEIENFKAVGSPGIRLEIRPVTLLFGPNSAGKSTVIQALHYFRDLLMHDDPVVDRLGGPASSLNIGGFENIVHGRDLSREIRIRVDCENYDLMIWQSWYDDYRSESERDEVFSEQLLNCEIKTLGLEVCVAWSSLTDAPYLRRCSIYFNGERCFDIESDPDRRDLRLVARSLIGAFSEFVSDAGCGGEEGTKVLEAMQSFAQEAFDQRVVQSVGKRPDRVARVIPHWGEGELSTYWRVPGDEPEVEPEYSLAQMRLLLSAMLLAPSGCLFESLQGMRYLGPLRDIPPRDEREALSSIGESWSRGLAAWRSLYRCEESRIEALNEWMSRADRLATGYGVRRERYLELPTSLLGQDPDADADPEALARMRSHLARQATKRRIVITEEATGLTLAAADVGAGLSQVLPVVVAVLDRKVPLVAVEQPELHVHPAVQVGLGDLFATAALASTPEEGDVQEWYGYRPRRRFLVETHSEHLMLRLLRRIRENAEGELPPGAPALKPEHVAVHILDRDNGVLRHTMVGIDETGEFTGRWPRGFFGERAGELF